MSLQGKRGRGVAARNEAVDGLIVEARRGLAATSTEKRITAGGKKLSPREVLEALLVRQGIDVDHPTPGKRPSWVRCEVCKIPVKNAKNNPQGGGVRRRFCAAHGTRREINRRAQAKMTPAQRAKYRSSEARKDINKRYRAKMSSAQKARYQATAKTKRAASQRTRRAKQDGEPQ